ncbi:acyltransferase [Aliivibrio salmonicida]|uniref:Lipopolysaccharide biosynthesis O-acetyl transferase n=1 Tax=Aliivibrio salmonicida (strain LFI1238) TaxID=316275 RepID=B6EHD5_ALISL|nr:acyltransferase [Aliivibrio salmonicida]AZL83577.1 acyltransferase [Aliivibrio salmonicida]AZL86090.1 acyltransferase [Aliivibrio salmonicida]CAQ80712.1 putative lipopolysaccharide biosynthesis O-acetyl transferase [Aliivibrio salmonicida LFI1238]
MLFKILWIIRGLIYKPFLGEFKLPSYIGKPIFISHFSRIFIAKRVRIFPGARIEPVDNESSIVFEENISIGQNFHITSKGKLTIGENTTILENVMITNIDHDYTEIGVHILKQKYITKQTSIGPNCFIGYGAVIQAGTILGTQCIVGANSVVRGTYPDYCVIVGVPAKIIKRYDPIDMIWKKTDTVGNFI